MSLLDSAFTPCVLLTVSEIPDGQGGRFTSYTDGASFHAAVYKTASQASVVGQTSELKETYVVTTRRDVVLKYHDVFRRRADGRIFRVVSGAVDSCTPPSAWLDMRQVTAELWEVPNDESAGL